MDTTQEQSNQVSTEATSYVVAVAFSRWPLGQLCQFLEEKLGVSQSDVGVMRIDRFKGKETNRTIMLVSRSLYNKALAKGYTEHQQGLDFKLTEYELKDHNLPKEGYTRNFFIPLPSSLTGDEARDQLQNKLNVLTDFGMFSDSPRLKIPLRSRETGEHRGQAYVTFSPDTSTNVIALARVLLHDTRLYTCEPNNEATGYERMRCFWAKEKDQTERSPRGKTSGRKMAPNKKGPVKKRSGRGPTKVPVTPHVTETSDTPVNNTPSNDVSKNNTTSNEVTLPPVVDLSDVDLGASMAGLPSLASSEVTDQ